MDLVPLTRSVMFVGDYFSLITTVDLSDSERKPGESDEDLACRIASEFLHNYYGWDVAAASNDIGVMDYEGEDDD